METKNAAFPVAVPLPELIDEYNYEEWAIRMRNYFKGQDLWNGIIDDDEDSNPEFLTQVNEYEATYDWRRRNFRALHVLQNSCGPHARSKIGNISLAKNAWETLKKKYLLDNGSIARSYLQYADLYRAVRYDHWHAAEDFLDSLPEAINKAITDKGETALHIAATFGHKHIVEELVRRMSKEDLGIEDDDGCTALMTALVCGKSKLARYLYDVTLPRDPVPAVQDPVTAEKESRKGVMLLTRAIYSRNLDIALDLIRRHPHLTHALDDRGESPFLALASLRHEFPSGNRLGCCKQWIYDHCISIPQSASSINEIRLNISNVENGSQSIQVTTIESERIEQTSRGQRNQVTPIGSLLSVLRLLVSIITRCCLLVRARDLVSSLLGIKQLYEMKKIHSQSNELLSSMCKEISTSLIQKGRVENIGKVYDAIDHAVKNGILEFVSMIVKTNPSFLENKYRNSRNLLMLAVLYRQSEIFSYIYRLDTQNTLTFYGDRNGNNVLHMAGMIEDSTRLNQIPGAALQMQRELQWFKEMERILGPNIKDATNRDDLTPRELFTKNHEKMMEKGEKWMKDTASSCTVVGALVVTIMFAVGFTIPGGNDQTTGFPIFLKNKRFLFFIIFDALSLFSSSISVLMFLGILTSRYAEDDFLKSLPRKMIIGFFTLFLSFATMIVAFSIALFIMLHHQYSWIVFPTFCLPSVPVLSFVCIQFPLLCEMIRSTCFSRGIFNRKIKLDSTIQT